MLFSFGTTEPPSHFGPWIRDALLLAASFEPTLAKIRVNDGRLRATFYRNRNPLENILLRELRDRGRKDVERGLNEFSNHRMLPSSRSDPEWPALFKSFSVELAPGQCVRVGAYLGTAPAPFRLDLELEYRYPIVD